MSIVASLKFNLGYENKSLQYMSAFALLEIESNIQHKYTNYKSKSSL